MIPLRLYLIAGVVLVIALMGWRIHSLTKARDEAVTTITLLKSANASNDQTIKTQGNALAEWRALGTSPEEAAVAVASMNDVMHLTEQLRDALAKSKETDRARPACEQFLSTDVELACPAISRGLRDAAGSHHKDN